MGSKSQISLPDLRVQDNEPPQRRSKAGQRKTASANRRRGPRGKKAEVIPAFLPAPEDADETRSAEKAEAEAGVADTEARDENAANIDDAADTGATDAQDTPEPVTAEAEDDSDVLLLNKEVGNGEQQEAAEPAMPGGALGSEGITDPELLALLEQLSNTIDNANQVLSDSPPLTGAVEDEYEAAGAAEVQDAAPPPAPERQPIVPAGRGMHIMLALLVLTAGAGGYWWLDSNPAMMNGGIQADTALTVTPARERVLASSQESVSIKVPIPAVDIPLPPRRPDPEAVTEPATQVVKTAALEPPSDEDPVAIMQIDSGAVQLQTPTEPAKGPAGEPINLGLSMPEDRAGFEVSVMIQGVPEGATLSAGNRIGGGTWVVEEQDVAQLALVTPSSFKAGEVSLDVAFVKSDGKVPESRSIGVVVEPAHAPVPSAAHGLAAADAGKAPSVPAPAEPAARGPAPGGTVQDKVTAKKTEAKAVPSIAPAVPSAAPAAAPEKPALDPETETTFLNRGARLLADGDVAGARLIFQHAARQGSKRAMIQLGRTYDPKHLEKLGVVGVQADMTQATAWYERASR